MGLAFALAVSNFTHAAVFNVPAGDVTALIAEITQANDEASNPGPDTINLGAGSYNLTNADLTASPEMTDGAIGLPSITSDITINGAADTSNPTLIQRTDGSPPFRIFHVATEGTLRLSRLTVTGGLAALADGIPSSEEGGGILNRGTLTLNNAVIRGNNADLIFGAGGGILNRGTATLIHSTIEGNGAGTFGGGINSAGGADSSARLTLSNSTVDRNTSGLDGGGVEIGEGAAQITNSTISRNFAARFGGGVANSGSTTTTMLINSTISGNRANGSGVETSNVGSGIENFNGATLTVNNVTVTNNAGDHPNIAGFVNASEVRSTVVISNTIIAQNANMDCAGSFNILSFRFSFGFGSINLPFPININGGFNLIGNNKGCSGFPITNTNDQAGSPDNPIDAKLSELQDNGGPTLTHAPLDGSPGIDKANPAELGLADNACAPIDQRVFLRPGGSGCEIGAVEVGAARTRAADLAVVIKTDSPDPVTAGDNLTYTVGVINNGPDTATGVTLTDALPRDVSLVSISPGCSESGGTVTCGLGTLASADTATVKIVVTPTTAGAITNSVSVSGDEPLDPYKSNNALVEDTTVSPTQCSDRLDNDGDRRIDFPADRGCSSATDNSESPDPPQCSDNRDNDSDRRTDFPLDPGCSSPTDNSESPDPPQCSDRLDNDGNGITDFPEDPGCSSATDNSERPDPTQQPVSFLCTLSKVIPFEGNVFYVGTCGGGLKGTVISVRNLDAIFPAFFLKSGRTNRDCTNPQAVVVVSPRGELGANGLQQLFGTSTPRLPIGFASCARGDPRSIPAGIALEITVQPDRR